MSALDIISKYGSPNLQASSRAFKNVAPAPTYRTLQQTQQAVSNIQNSGTSTYNPPPPNNGNQSKSGDIPGTNLFVGDQRNGQRWNGNSWETLGGSGGGAPAFDQAAFQNQLNAVYDPAEKYLTDIEAQYAAEYPTSVKQLELQQADALAKMQKEQGLDLGEIDTQRLAGQREQKGQIASARNLYNELKTSGLTRFGGGSSTGEAYGELLGRSTSQQMGDIQSKFSDYYLSLEKERGNVNNYYRDQLSTLEEKKKLAMTQLKQDYDNKRLAIQGQKAQLAGAKASQMLDLLREYAAEARKIQYEADTFKRNLDVWTTQKNELIDAAVKFGAKNVEIPGLNNVMGGFTLPTGTQTTSATNTSNIKGYWTNPEIGSWSDKTKIPVGKAADGRTIYSDGSMGWTQWDYTPNANLGTKPVTSSKSPDED